MEADGWLAQAQVDTTVVAEMLMRLRHPQAETRRASQAGARMPGSWWVVRKRPRTAVKLGGWCYSEAVKREAAASRVQQEVEGKEKAGSPMTPLSWSVGVVSGGSGVDGSDSSCDGKVKAERMVQVAAASGSGGGGVRLKAAAREANASKLLSKRTAKRKSLTVLKEEENQLLSDKANLEKEVKALMANYMVAVEQNKRLKRLHEGLQTMSSPKALDVAPDTVKGVLPAPLRPSDVPECVMVPTLLPCSSSSTCEEAFMIPDLNLPLDDTVMGSVA